jgi:hypothetical protein
VSTLLLSGVRVTYSDGLHVRALVREDNRLTKVVRDRRGWTCECGLPACRHVRAVQSVTRTS